MRLRHRRITEVKKKTIKECVSGSKSKIKQYL
nr:MAG TPA: hypothetical protein [Caudoviricetes sp.]